MVGDGADGLGAGLASRVRLTLVGNRLVTGVSVSRSSELPLILWARRYMLLVCRWAQGQVVSATCVALNLVRSALSRLLVLSYLRWEELAPVRWLRVSRMSRGPRGVCCLPPWPRCSEARCLMMSLFGTGLRSACACGLWLESVGGLGGDARFWRDGEYVVC